jgi:tRNA threonylcarbamoyladenosine biosynthesis protein TsaB
LALILNIDTATENASICLSQNGKVIAFEESVEQKNHASFLQPAIQKIIQQSSISINSLDAIAVTFGPGSYTGLRVGLASAKGICYALHKPLITLNTLEVMAWAAKQSIEPALFTDNQTPILFCPMIDARRMEVFVATFNQQLQMQLATTAMILQEDSFITELTAHQVFFSGNGSTKLKNILKNSNAYFIDVVYSATSMVAISDQYYQLQSFASLAYSEPFYGKEFYTPPSKK